MVGDAEPRSLDLQSEHKSSTSTFEVIDAQVSRLDASPATPRRRWSVAAKERIVAAASEPGANVSAIARAHG
jgi:transposase